MYSLLNNSNRSIIAPITPPPERLVRYFEMLRNNYDWVETIGNNCPGPSMPTLPPEYCTQTIFDKVCSCCTKNWSIVIGTNFASQYVPMLVGITDIKRSGNVIRVYGYIYPDLSTVKEVPLAIIHVGCYFQL